MAQTTGCLVPSQNKVYTDEGNSNYYDDDTFTTNACGWTPNTSGTTCDVCVGGLNPGGNCPGNRVKIPGFEGSFTMVLCPLDDYIPLLLLAISILGFSYLRRKNKPISVIR